MGPVVKLLDPEEARDEALVAELVRIINDAYAVGEAGLWVESSARTGPGEIAEAIRSGGMLAATRDRRLVGCAYVRPLEEGAADLSLISAVPDQWGSGVGRQLVDAIEADARSRGKAGFQVWSSLNAAGFYAALGYQRVRRGRWPLTGTIEIDYLLLAKGA
jgi:GNAT superfamily N-acetyltransferase